MALCVRYFNDKSMKIETDFLGIVEVYRTTADALHESVISYLAKIKLPSKIC